MQNGEYDEASIYFDKAEQLLPRWAYIHINQGILVALILIHILAIVFYLVGKGENLIKPMLTGYKQWHEPVNSSGGNPFLALVITGILAGMAYLFLYL